MGRFLWIVFTFSNMAAAKTEKQKAVKNPQFTSKKQGFTTRFLNHSPSFAEIQYIKQ